VVVLVAAILAPAIGGGSDEVAGAAAAELADGVTAAIERGDAAWSRRADGHDGLRARPGPIETAIEAYREAWQAGRDDDASGAGAGSAAGAVESTLEAGWKLLRALWFAGEFAAPDEAAAQERFDQARAVSEALFRELEAVAGREPGGIDPERFPEVLPASLHADAARGMFWSAIAWGAWGRSHGLWSMAREGVASRLHHGALASVALDPSVFQGGAQRLLSRAHARFPGIPFLTGWVDRSQAVPWAERALEVSREHPGNHYLLATAILDTGVESRRDEAIAILERLADLEPREEQVLEDLVVRQEVRQRLDRIEEES
jgi:hypothetical protein